MNAEDEARVREIVAEMLTQYHAPPTVTVDASKIREAVTDAIRRFERSGGAGPTT